MSVRTATMRDTHIFLPCAALGFLMFFLLQKSIVLGLAMVIFLGVFALVVRWPELGTLTVLFAIYSNIAVLGMKTRAILSASVQTGQMTISTAGQNSRVAIVMAGLCLILCVPLVYQFLVRKEKLTFERGFYLLLGYFIVFLMSSFFARDNRIVTSQIIDFLLEGVAIYFLVVNIVRDYATLKRASWALLLAGSLMGGLSIFQRVTHTQNKNYGGLAMLGAELDFNPTGRELSRPRAVSENFHPEGGTSSTVGTQFRSAGPIGEPNRYAQVLVVLFPLAALRFRRERSRVLRLLAAVSAGLIFGGMILTFSRGAMLTSVVIFGMLAYFRFIRPLHVVAAGLSLSLLVLVLDPQVALRFASLGAAKTLIGQRVAGYKEPTAVQRGIPDTSVVRRYELNVAAWHVFLDHPILGVGPGHFAAYYSIPYSNRVGLIEQLKQYRGHNLYFETLAETGILGLASFLVVILAVMQGLWRAWKKWQPMDSELADTAMAFFLSLVAYLISAIFAHLSYQRYLWLLIGLCSVTIHILDRMKPPVAGEWVPRD
jgi:O-antigen ligase/polysaccharide polymerase Wzy-like membrane protein